MKAMCRIIAIAFLIAGASARSAWSSDDVGIRLDRRASLELFSLFSNEERKVANVMAMSLLDGFSCTKDEFLSIWMTSALQEPFDPRIINIFVREAPSLTATNSEKIAAAILSFATAENFSSSDKSTRHKAIKISPNLWADTLSSVIDLVIKGEFKGPCGTVGTEDTALIVTDLYKKIFVKHIRNAEGKSQAIANKESPLWGTQILTFKIVENFHEINMGIRRKSMKTDGIMSDSELKKYAEEDDEWFLLESSIR